MSSISEAAPSMQQINHKTNTMKEPGSCLEHTKEEDLELKQNISRSRNPSSDLIIGIVQLSKLKILVSHQFLMVEKDLFLFPFVHLSVTQSFFFSSKALFVSFGNNSLLQLFKLNNFFSST